MKTLKIWLLGLALFPVALTPACVVVDGGDDSGGDDDESGGGNTSGNTSSNTSANTSSNTSANTSSNTSANTSNDGPADSSDGGGPDSDVGEQCTSNDDCQTICLFLPDTDFGFCSVPCEDVFDCPSFWECVEVENATLTYCAPGE